MPCHDFGTHDVKCPDKRRRNAGDGLVIVAEIETNTNSCTWPRAFVHSIRQRTIHEGIRKFLILGWTGGSELVAMLCEMCVAFPSVGKWHAERVFTIPQFLFQVPIPSLVHAADWCPRIDADGRREFLELEPRAGLIGADLEGYSLAQDVDRQLEVFQGGRA